MNLLDQVCQTIRLRHLSERTERAYLDWIYRYTVFYNNQLPKELGEDEVSTFLNFLARERQVSAATQHQALQAILFLYREVLGQPINHQVHIDKAKQTRRQPAVLSREEVQKVLKFLKGEAWLMAALLYGCGLRVTECLNLRI